MKHWGWGSEDEQPARPPSCEPPPRSCTIAVLGPGAVGGFVAAALARSGADVAVIARDETAAVIAARGISVASAALGSFTARVRCEPLLTENVDFLIITPKATGLLAALGRVRSAPGLVVPLLNGLEHMDLLRSRLHRSSVAAGVIRIESDRPAPGQIIQTSPAARIDLAADKPQLAARLGALGSALRAAGIEVRIGTGERQVLWSKLARLNALALTTSASDRPIGFVRSNPRWRSALEDTVAETVAVANADGARLESLDTLAELEQAHAELGSSMRRDIAAGREPELDAIAGAVLRAGARHGIPCPTVQRLTARVAARAGVAAPGLSWCCVSETLT